MKRLSIYLASFLILSSFLFTSCSSVDGTGDVKKEKRTVDDFSAIRLDVPAEVIITYSDTPSVEIEAQQNILDVVYTRVHGKRLNIDSDKRLGKYLPIKIYVSMNKVEEIKVNGSGKVKTTNIIKANKLELGLSGSGEFFIHANCEKITADIYGSGVFHLAGKASVGELSLSGSGDFDAERMTIDECETTINGSGDATLTVGSSLDATINGSGRIEYYGEAPKVKTSVNGSGKVIKKEASASAHD